MSLFRKSLILLCLAILGLICGQLILTGLLIVSNADLTNATDIQSLIANLDSPLVFKLGIGINNILIFGVSAVAYNWIVYKQRFSQYFQLDKKITIDYLGLGLIFMISVYPILAYSVQIMKKIQLPEWVVKMDTTSAETLMSLLEMNSPVDFIINLLIVAVIPSICEELFFRGVIQKELNNYLSNPHVAVVIASILFSAVHTSVEGFFSRMLLGMVIGYVYYYTKNLWYPIILHLFNNGTQIIALYFSGESINDIDPTDVPNLHWSIALVSMVISIAIFVILKTKSEKDGIRA